VTAPDRDPVVAALTEIASIWHDYNSMQVLDRLDNEAMAELDRRWANIPAAFAAALPIARAQAALVAELEDIAVRARMAQGRDASIGADAEAYILRDIMRDIAGIAVAALADYRRTMEAK